MLTIVTPAINLPVTVAQASAQVHAPENGDDDELVERALRSSVEFVEENTGLALAPTVFEYRVSCWPIWRGGYLRGHVIDLPRKPVRDVLSVEYLDADGNLQAVATGDWSWRSTPDGALIRFANSYGYPDLYAESDDAIRVTFEAGFDNPTDSGSGDDPNLNLPNKAIEAVLLQTELLYDRGGLEEAEAAQIERALASLLGQLKVYR